MQYGVVKSYFVVKEASGQGLDGKIVKTGTAHSHASHAMQMRATMRPGVQTCSTNTGSAVQQIVFIVLQKPMQLQLFHFHQIKIH